MIWFTPDRGLNCYMDKKEAMLEKEFEIASLIAGYRTGILTEEEKACLQEWIDSSLSAKLLFEKLDNPGTLLDGAEI